MIVLGLTGSIGMGKSTTLAMFSSEGVPVYSADAAVHELYEGEAVPLIAEAFPGTVEEGKVDRDRLSKAVIGKPQDLKRLENIVHPLVRLKELEFIRKARKSGAKLAVVDIPLLFETGAESRVDKVLVVTTDPIIQRERVMARAGMTEEKLNAIIARQMPDAEKRARAHYTIDTGKGIEFARDAVHAIIQSIKESGTHA